MRPALALLLLAAALAALLASELRGRAPAPGPAAPSPSPAPGVASAIPAPRAPAVPPLAALPETVARPLFSSDRRPPAPDSGPAPAPAPVAEAPVPAPSFVLSAVVLADGERLAYLEDPGRGGLRRVRPGETLDGWRVLRIEADRVVVARGDARLEIALRKYRPVPVPPRPGAGTRRGALAPAPVATGGRATGAVPGRSAAVPGAVEAREPRRPRRGPRQRALERARRAAEQRQ